MIAASSVPVVVMLTHFGVWLLAWGELGHPPRPSIDDPGQITVLRFLYVPVVLLVVFIPPAMIVSAITWVIIAWDEVRPGGNRRGLRVLLPLLVWIGFFAWVRHDPGQVLVWLGD